MLVTLHYLTGVLTAPAHGDGGGGPVWLVVILVGLGYWAGYRISIRLHPFKACRRCRGSGRHRGAFFTHAFRACDRCRGTGRELRVGAKKPDR